MPFFRLALVLCALCAGLPRTAPAEPLVHVVKSGETLSQIARRYQVSVDQVRQWNRLSGDGIIAGQRLDLWSQSPPAWYTVKKGDTLSDIAARFGLSTDQVRRFNKLSQNRINAGQKLRLRAQKSPPPAQESPQSPTPKPQKHRVKKGDTLSKIARTYGVSVAHLKKVNGLENDTINPGQSLGLRAPPEDPQEEEPHHYSVKKGDTLSEIARRFDVGLSLLRQLNKLEKDRIHPGQKLKLRPAVEDEGIHIVRGGETLSEIAVRYRLTLDRLKELNGIENSRILVGQKLRLKAAPSATHVVERGDALWEIARAYSMTVGELQQLNGLKSSRIYPGQELKLNVEKAQRLAAYTVEKGDYLGEIARLHQMSVAEVKKLNDLRGSVIHPGDVLKVRPLLGNGKERLKLSEIDWDGLLVTLGGIRKVEADNGPYYFAPPKAARQKSTKYDEASLRSPLRTYKQARKLWKAFEREVGRLGHLSNTLKGWHVVLDPGHGGQDPGAVVQTLDGNGNKLYVVEDEYVYDIALRVYVLLRLHGAAVTMTLLSPNHLTRHSSPPSQTFVNQKNEVYNSYALNKRNIWPRGGNLSSRVSIAREAFAQTPKNRCIFLSFHADNEKHAPEAPQVLYYENGRKKDLASRNFARILLPALGAGARTRGQNLGVLRGNPAGVKVLLEVRNLAHANNSWSLRFEQYRHRDAEKVVKGLLDYARRQGRSARR
jgi:N-acetylmuramoyl-L-alanine amidase